MRIVKTLVTLGILGALLVIGGRFLVGLTSSDPVLLDIGADLPRGGCASTDNCVSSYATELPWAIGHLTCDADPTRTREVAERVILGLERAEAGDGPDHFVVYSPTFRFPDDIRLETSQRGVEIGSASRLGAGDLGVNRKRVEEIAAAMARDITCGGSGAGTAEG